MIKFTLYQKNPASHYIYIDLETETLGAERMYLQLPAWRPGRYELVNFAKNIKKPEAFGDNNQLLKIRKLGKDLWEIDCTETRYLKFTYSYYAAELNAGSCYADEQQLYVNPVHCCFMIKGREEEEQQVHVKVPDSYKIATSLPEKDKVITAPNFQELADSPFIASAMLVHDSYQSNGVTFHLHFNGICKPNWTQLKTDFKKFTDYQFDFWGDFPFNEYHFLFQITPHRFYHGVEHLKNTVIALGPGYSLNHQLYEDVLGVSAHELFHAWNIKTIRPAAMLPYDFTKENFSDCGFVYEGFTTYYGDKNLFSANVFSSSQYFKTLDERLNRHFHNFGRYNYSVADSSWDTWLDGYVPGAPYRKTNIYDEGCLVAFMLDVLILKHSNNKHSLRDVCVKLYHEYGKKNKGYVAADIIHWCNFFAGSDLGLFFDQVVFSATDYEEYLQPCFDYLGFEFRKEPSKWMNENTYGFKTADSGNMARITLVAPYSPAWKAGLFQGQEIVAVNTMAVKNDLNDLLVYFNDEPVIQLHVISNELIKTIYLNKGKADANWFFNTRVRLKEPANEAISANFTAWLSN